MRFKLKCKLCQATCWARGCAEFGGVDLREPKPWESGLWEWEPETDKCQHEEFEIIDEEYEDVE